MRRLHFGGSFNPIHFGHLITARAVAEVAGFDRVILIPSQISPHKLGWPTASAVDRLAMCRLAVEGDALFEVDSIETERTGPSYTIDTAEILHRRGESAVFWLIGADMAATLPSWQRAEQLLQQVNFVLMARPGWSLDPLSLPMAVRHLASRVVTAPQIDISSTLIRQRASAGLTIRNLAPAAVVDYIGQRGLYRDDQSHLPR